MSISSINPVIPAAPYPGNGGLASLHKVAGKVELDDAEHLASSGDTKAHVGPVEVVKFATDEQGHRQTQRRVSSLAALLHEKPLATPRFMPGP